jgi:hypothetical protein
VEAVIEKSKKTYIKLKKTYDIMTNKSYNEGTDMKPYIIKKTITEPYNALIISFSYESPYYLWNVFEKELINNNINGKVLIDCLLYNGNNENRFIEVDFNNSFNDKSIKNAVLDRNNYYRILASEILSEYPEIIEYSILNEFQKKLLLNKVTL